MKLITQELRQKLPKLYTENDGDPIVELKLFCPWGGATWLITEYDGSDLMFGWATMGDPDCAEWGYVSLGELEGIRGPAGLGIERDRHWTPKPMSEAKRQYER